jgi:MFS transporter, OFA family, oxalate/formate antiporter
MEPNHAAEANPKIFYGWIITGAVFMNLGMAYGAQYSFGVLFPSLIEEFKWTRQSIAGAFSLYNFMYCTLAILLGRWSDRFGPRAVLLCGSVCLGGGIGLISLVQAPWHLYVVYGLLASWGMSAAYITASPTIVKWFIRKRGLAVGVAQAGLGIGIMAIPPLCGSLIAALGWRHACLILGAAVFLVIFLMALFLVERPEKLGLKPDGETSSPRTAEIPIDAEFSYSSAEAIRTRSFWILTALFFCTWLFVFVPLVHMVIFAIDIGVGQKAAFVALSAFGAASTIGRLGSGALSDRIGRKTALGINIVLQIVAWFWAMATGTSWMLFCFAAIFGFSYGGISTLFAAIVGDYFGRLRAGSIIGAMFTFSGGASAIGPVLAGYIYDSMRSYQLSFALGAASNMITLILLFISKPPPRKVRV